ncbi:IDEAL domain-containing protein [Pontibacillus yanchengensis]|uniref:IDEAL domain-containing protein n=2 Tax=Pontibacillus yanchengensis TaxID=462910 RepID=A0ACC7VKA2_9BACI|nr:IDEAL domain-containing protein [Pontibacillus yanchengensis]MYL36073.1 IDEAL domain-containing protein [Pontibacillus yanchengensis]MYL54369.1 IDEAL domain-containing protein [Pontibacillus yanchengensis]
MLSVRMLKPFYVKHEENCIRIMLAYQYFSIHFGDDLYQFTPIEGREIVVDRKTKKITNVNDVLVFQKGKHMMQITIQELLDLPDFVTHVHSIASRYLNRKKSINMKTIDKVILELERENAMRLIDQALDKQDEPGFIELSSYLKQHF